MEQEMTEHALYFAYGSNLNRRHWGEWRRRHGLPQYLLRYVGNAWLPDHQLAFTMGSGIIGGGTLDLQPDRGSLVPGALFELAPGGLEALDRKEGAPHHYRRMNAVALDDHGREVPVMTYIGTPERRSPFHPPCEHYLDLVREGYEVRGIADTDTLEGAAREDGGPLINQIFVYGTLLRGEVRHQLLRAVGDVCPAWVQGHLFDQRAYPAAVFHRFHPLSPGRESHGDEFDHGRIVGEVVRVSLPHQALEVLDAVEGFHGWSSERCLYRRTLVEIHGPGPRTSLAWSYQFADTSQLRRGVQRNSWRVHIHDERGTTLGDLACELRALPDVPQPPLSVGPTELTWCGHRIQLSTRPLSPMPDPTDLDHTPAATLLVSRYARTLGWLFRAVDQCIYAPCPGPEVYARMARSVRHAAEIRCGVISERDTIAAALDALARAIMQEPELPYRQYRWETVRRHDHGGHR